MRKVFIAILILGLGTACTITPGSKRSGHGLQRSGYVKGKAKPRGFVKRSAFTSAIENREPVDARTQFGNDKQRVYYFTELRGMQGQKVKHRWKYNGKVMAEVEFHVKGPRWRVHSSKWLQRGWLGTWTATVVDRSGRTLAADSFTYAKVSGSWWPKASAPANTSSAAVEDSYLDRATRGAVDLYEEMFGSN